MTEDKRVYEQEIKDFILCDDKPDWCKSSDVAVMVYLMAVADGGGNSSQRQAKIALCTGGGKIVWKATREAIKRLHDHQWITVRPMEGRTTYTVHFDHIPPHPQIQPKEDSEKTAP
jgi:hypothetical protein